MALRILHVLDHSIPLHSGYSFRTRAILEQQRALGWETFHLTGAKHTAGPGLSEEDVDGLHFYRSPPLPRALARLPMANQWAVVHGLARRLDEVAAQLQPDVIHAHSPALNGLAALGVARRRGLPLVYEVRAFWEDAAVDHGTTREGSLRYRLTRALETRVLRRADAVTCICEGLRRDITGRGIAPERVTVIPNAVDAERFTYDPARDDALAAELDLGDGPVLGFIGSFYGYEGLDLALQSMPAILQAHPQARLLLVGGGPQADRLAAQVRELGLEGAVRLTGRVPHDQVHRYYSLVDVFVYPRRSMRLTELVTPLKPLEAMAQGRLVVASDVGGHRELIRDGETGQLFRAGDAGDMADAVCRLLGRRDDWPALRQAGRHFVETERSWPASVGRYTSVYPRSDAQGAEPEGVMGPGASPR